MVIKLPFVSYILATFRLVPAVMYIKYNPSSHVENRLKLYDPGGNIYY